MLATICCMKLDLPGTTLWPQSFTPTSRRTRALFLARVTRPQATTAQLLQLPNRRLHFLVLVLLLSVQLHDQSDGDFSDFLVHMQVAT